VGFFSSNFSDFEFSPFERFSSLFHRPFESLVSTYLQIVIDLLTSLVILSYQSISPCPYYFEVSSLQSVLNSFFTNHYPRSTTHSLSFAPNSFICHTSEISLRKFFICHTSKNAEFKVLCVPHIQKMAGVGVLLLTRNPHRDFYPRGASYRRRYSRGRSR